MPTDLHLAILELGDYLKSSPEYRRLQQLSAQMESDEEVIKLHQLFSSMEDNYNLMLRIYSENSNEVKTALKVLYQAKLNLDNHPLVKEYYLKLSAVNEPLRYLQYELIYKYFR